MEMRSAFRALACLVAFAALPAAAQQSRSATPPGAAPLSLQSQLGSIPLVSPRALAKPAMTRAVRLSQLAGHEPIGTVRDIECPDTGCQQVISLMVDGTAQSFLADIQFVSQGIYVALQSRSAAIGGVVDFQKGRPGPVFIRGASTGTTDQRLSFTAAPAASLRKLERPADGNVLASGNHYTRKREPDIVLRVEVGPARERR